MSAYIHVAVGVIRSRDGRVLLARRRDDAHQGGLWEFPGGKLQGDESVQNALQRELEEELAIGVSHCQPLIQIRHHYADKSVLLDVWEVDRYHGVPKGNEGQPLAWVAVDQLSPGSDCLYPLPAANAAIVKALQLPDKLLITGGFASTEDFVARLERALERGIRFVQFRPPPDCAMAVSQLEEHLALAASACANAGAKLIANASVGLPPDAIQGLHLPSQQLMARSSRPVGPEQLLGASCHNADELERAAALDVDFILLSPVKPTTSHPGAEPLAWKGFRSLVERVNVPVYALGGMSRKNLTQARAMGGQGIAAIGAFWND